MDKSRRIKFGVTQEFPCNYIDGYKEQLLVLMDPSLNNDESYEDLLKIGFRRSGNQIYRPHCKQCIACESLRIDVNEFKASKSQKRVLSKNKDITIKFSSEDKVEYYDLYQKYVDGKHFNGAMYPATSDQYTGFILSDWASAKFIELWLNKELVGVAVTDVLPDSMSALYTFYDPQLEERSLGTFSVLKQIEWTQQSKRTFLYLGYQIDDCQKMNYKTRFKPYQRLKNGQWFSSDDE